MNILYLQSDIVDVNTIFKYLATLVHIQGETIDSIEGNVETAAITVHDGTEQLRQAERYKVRSPLKLVVNVAQFLFLFLVIFCSPFFVNINYDFRARQERRKCA